MKKLGTVKFNGAEERDKGLRCGGMIKADDGGKDVWLPHTAIPIKNVKRESITFRELKEGDRIAFEERIVDTKRVATLIQKIDDVTTKEALKRGATVDLP